MISDLQLSRPLVLIYRLDKFRAIKIQKEVLKALIIKNLRTSKAISNAR